MPSNGSKACKTKYTLDAWRENISAALVMARRKIELPPHLAPWAALPQQLQLVTDRVSTSRHSAVLILFFPTKQPTSDEEEVELCCPVIKRSASMTSHRGQLALPGGRCDTGENFLETAERETLEEIGVGPTEYKILGRGQTLYSFPSASWVHPYVALSRNCLSPFPASPSEVDSVHYLHLSEILFNSARSQFTHSIQFPKGIYASPGWYTSPSIGQPTIIDPLPSRGSQVEMVSLSKEPTVWGLTGIVIGELFIRLAHQCNVPIESTHVVIHHIEKSGAPPPKGGNLNGNGNGDGARNGKKSKL